MKLIKIGSSSSCDIVLHSEFVSSLHAEITLLDNGDIILEDKNSRNGTFVGTKRLNPNQETSVRRGDLVRFADTDLVWARVPVVDNNRNYKSVINIGSNFRNDVVVNSEVVSRFHAALKTDKSGKVFLVDNNSKNGTTVNGVKIPAGKPIRIKRGDNVMVGTEDITELLIPYMPAGVPSWLKIGGAIVAVAAVLACVGFAVWKIIGKSPVDAYRPAVVYVRAGYHYEVTLDEEGQGALPSPVVMRYPAESDKQPYYFYQATAFFIDKDGCLATNRHVAMPWDEAYRDEDVTKQLRQAYKEYISDQLKVDLLNFNTIDESLINAINALQSTSLGRDLLNDCSSSSELNARLNMIKTAKVKITGVLDFITVGYPGRYYTHGDEFQRCNVLAESGDKDIDLAILQLNDKKTPSDVKVLFDVNNFKTDDLEPMKDNLYTIGYPYGIEWGQDDNTKSLEPTIGETKCTKMPSKYTFEFNTSTVGGSSGSPVFTKDGQLVGVLSSGIQGQTITLAVHAKYLKNMYDEEVIK